MVHSLAGKRVLLTGASGYLGSHLLRALIAAGCLPTIMLRRSSRVGRIRDLIDASGCVFIEEVDFDVLFQAGRFDAVMHVATDYGRTHSNAAQIIDANVVFPVRLAQAAARAGVMLFLNTNTALPPDVSDYALSKRQFSDWLPRLLPSAVVIDAVLEHYFGPDDDPSKFVSHVVQGLVDNVASLELTAGEQRRDFIFINDLVAAILTLLTKGWELSPAFHAFPVGSGLAMQLREFVETIKEICENSQTQLIFGARPYRQNETMYSCADLTKMRQVGWSPAIGWREGLRQTILSEKRRRVA